MKSDEKACPFCAEPIKAAAIKCKHCGEMFTASSSDSARSVPLIRIDASDFVAQLASGSAKEHLNQLFTMNHRWIAMLSERNRRTAAATYDFIEENMADALFVLDQFKVIASKKHDIMTLGGQILDLGVFKGGNTRDLARIFPDDVVHGFDSFEGLPEDWSYTLKGSFDIAGVMPDMPVNVKLYKGWFDDSLPLWLKEHNDRPISLLRVDCDIYSSTKTIFSVLRPLIKPGSWIVFDELIGYRGWQDHEYRAFMEFIGETGYGYEFVAYGLTYAIVKLI